MDSPDHLDISSFIRSMKLWFSSERNTMWKKQLNNFCYQENVSEYLRSINISLIHSSSLVPSLVPSFIYLHYFFFLFLFIFVNLGRYYAHGVIPILVYFCL